jgi:hypothetical protein
VYLYTLLFASQSWYLARHILLIIHCDSPGVTNYLKLITLLIKIMLISFAPKLKREQTYELDGLVERHHKLFIELFPE